MRKYSAEKAVERIAFLRARMMADENEIAVLSPKTTAVQNSAAGNISISSLIDKRTAAAKAVADVDAELAALRARLIADLTAINGVTAKPPPLTRSPLDEYADALKKPFPGLGEATVKFDTDIAADGAKPGAALPSLVDAVSNIKLPTADLNEFGLPPIPAHLKRTA